MKRVVILIIAFMAVAALISIRVEAAEPDDYDFSQIDEVMGNTDFDFKETVKLFSPERRIRALPDWDRHFLIRFFLNWLPRKAL